MAETKNAEEAFDLFLKTYEAKYREASACLANDRAKLLSFYDFPTEHWKHLRTTTPWRACSPPCGCGIAGPREASAAPPA